MASPHKKHGSFGGHVGMMRAGSVICRFCEQVLERCTCSRDDDKEPNPYCTGCRGTGWVLAERKVVLN